MSQREFDGDNRFRTL